MEILWVILALLTAFIMITLIRAAFFKVDRVEGETFEEELVHSERVQEKLTKAIQIKTISHENDNETDWGEFQKFHDFLRESFPLVHENLTVEDVSKASLLFYWKGTDEKLDPIAFLA